MSEVQFLPAEAPTFRPSVEEWKDPISYIAFVRRNAEAAGVAKVIPPAGWEPGFAIDKRRQKLPTKVVSVHQLQSKDTSAAEKQFWENYNAFMEARGSKLKKKPTFIGQEIDLYRLFRLVTKRGGYDVVSEEKGWKDMVAALQIIDKGGSAGYTLKSHYQRLLLAYEDHCRAETNGGAGLLAAAMEADLSDDKSEQIEGQEDIIDDDEAAEILEAMLGLAPAVQAAEPSKKRKKSSSREPSSSSHGGIKIPDNIFTMVCEKCKGGHYEEKIILCDRCDKGWHLFCLAPPLETVPEGDWICPSCVAVELEGDATRKGDNCTIDDLERIGTNFERQWFGSDEAAAAASPATRESEFWRVVEEGEDIAEVVMASDLDTAKFGSGFPKRKSGDAEPQPEATHPWNLTNIPSAGGEHGNLLRLIDGHIPGITSSLLTVSTLFAALPWKVQPHELYGLDYLHYGAPRRHYAVPAHAAALLEGSLRSILPENLAHHPEVLYRIHCLLSPKALMANGVPVTAITQEPGTFILTFPNAYTTAVSLGNSCSESVAIAPPDWLRFGAMSLSKYRHYRQPSLFSQEKLVVRTASAAIEPDQPQSPGDQLGTAESNRPSARACHWVGQELKRVVTEERVMRAKLWSEGLIRSRKVDQPTGMDFGDEKDSECAICRMPLHLSAVECDCCPRRRTCLHHAANLCECPMRRRRLAWRHTLRDLEQMERGVEAKVPAEVTGQIFGEEAEATAAIEAAAKECAAVAMAAAEANAAARHNAEVFKKEEEGEAMQVDEIAAAEPAEPAAAKAATKVEEVDDLEALAGFMTVMGAAAGGEGSKTEAESKEPPAKAAAAPVVGQKRKREADGAKSAVAGADAATLTLVTGNGYVQGPVRPFQILDVYPEDRDATAEWLQDLQRSCASWRERARLALEQGGGMAADLTDLVEEAEQYLWGGVSEEEEALVRELQPRLADAEDYMAAVNTALRGKPPLEVVEALLNQEPKPLVNPPGLEQLQEASTAARDWLARCSDLVFPDAPAVDIRTLEAAVNEASRLPLALPEAKALRERLNTARKVGDAIRSALPTAREAGRRKKDEAAITIEYLQALSIQASSARVDMPEVANLSSALDRIESWHDRVNELTAVRTSLADLKALLDEADTLPAVLPEADHLRAQCERAESWLRHMQSLVKSRAPLKKLRDQLHAGLRLPVQVPEVEELRQDIRRREWEETARKATNTKGTLHALMEVLSTAADMDAENSQLALTLQAKVDAAATWERSAAAFLAKFQNADGSSEESKRPEIHELAEVVNTGTATGVRMERLQYLTQQLQAANKWLNRAKNCIPAAAPPPQESQKEEAAPAEPTMEVPPAEESKEEPAGSDGAEPMETEEGSGGGDGEFDPIALALAMEAAAAEATEPEKSASPPPPPPREPGRPGRKKKIQPPQPVVIPSYDNIVALLSEYDEKLIIRADEAEGLRALRAKAEVWLEEARPILEQDFVVDEQLPLLNELIAKGRATGVAMEQVEILDANVEALLWSQTVRGILEKLPPLPEAPKTLDPEETEADKAGAASAKDTAAPAARATLAAGTEDAPPDVPPPADVTTLTSGVPPMDSDPSASDDERPIPTTPFDQRPALPRLMTLLEEGSILPCDDDDVFAKFKAYVEAGQEWERTARNIISLSKDGGPASLVGIRQLRKLIMRGERLALGMPALPRLHEVLRTHDKWEQRVRDLMSSAGTRPAFAELQVFQQTARMSPVTSNLRRHIDAAVSAVDVWKERCRRNIAKRNTGMRLDRCFEVLGHSIDCAVEQFERRLEVEKRLVANAPPRRPGIGPDGEEDERELYCLCQQPYNVDTSMISCDLCGEWYHMRCVGVTQAQARTLRKYSCPICAAVRNVMDPLEYALGKLRRTRRPTRTELGALLEEVRTLPVTIEEESQLDKLLVKYDRWATATNRAVEVHEASRKKDSGGQVLPLSDGMLHQLCKSALALEIDGTDHAERILHLLRCNRWRARVDAVLGASASAPGGKASAEAVAKLLNEAERLEVDAPNDVAGARLLAAADAAKNWQESVKACIAELKAAGGAADPAFNKAVEKAKELIKEANDLPVRVDRELDKLNEYSKPYCLCRRAYDEQIPMLECDSCGEWYHFECVGLRSMQGGGAGGSEGDGGDPVPDNFSCPICCMRTSKKYPFFHKLPQASIDVLKEAAEKIPPPGSAAPAAAGTAAAAAPATTAAMHPQQTAATLAAAQMAMYPQQAWPFMAAAAAAQGMMVHPAALYAQFGGMHPAMVQAMQQQQQAAAAAAAAAQQQQAQQQQAQQQATTEGAEEAPAAEKSEEK